MGENSAVQLDMNVEKLGVLCLQWRESRFDQLTPILHYSNSALGHFKKYRCARMKLLIIVRMGEQHFAVGGYEKALQILSHAMWEYRQEKWWLPLRQATLLALKCSYALANLKAYIALALEALSPRLQVDDIERMRIQQNLSAVLQGRMPNRESLFGDERSGNDYSSLTPAAAEAYAKINALWMTLLNDRCFFLVSMNNMSSCLDVTARFASATRRACTKIGLIIYVRSTAMAPLEFSKLSLQFTHSAYDQLCVINHDPAVADRRLIFAPNEVRSFTFEFFPLPEDVNSQIVVRRFRFQRGVPLLMPCFSAAVGFARRRQHAFECLRIVAMGEHRPEFVCHQTGVRVVQATNTVQLHPASSGHWVRFLNSTGCGYLGVKGGPIQPFTRESKILEDSAENGC